MKRFLALATSGVLLVSCGGREVATCSADYWDGTFGTCLPEGWAVVDEETLRQRGVPEETIVAFQREEAVSGQFPTLAVTKEPLQSPVTPAEYSAASIRSVSVLPGYTLVDLREITIDGEDVQLHIFTGQPIGSEPMRRFYQVSTTVGDAGYTVTATTPVSIDDALEQAVLLMLRNATFVAPEEEET